MKNQFLVGLRVTLLFTIVCGIIYPLSVLATGQLLFSHQAEGSLIHSEKKVVGSSLLGQNFDGDQWFHPRPSNAGDGYVATASGASNLGPSNKDLISTVRDRAKMYRKENRLDSRVAIPVDAVTSSGSGLDPSISLENANLQAKRVARERGVSLGVILKLINKNTDDTFLGFLGEKTVNVVTLNKDISQLK